METIMGYHANFAATLKSLANKYDHLPTAKLTGPVCQEPLETDTLADDFLRAYCLEHLSASSNDK